MDTLAFLQRVLPTEGKYVLALFIKGYSGASHKYYDSLDDMAKAALKFSGQNHNTYYAVASYCTEENRKATNVNKLKSFFMDLDCGPDEPGKGGKPPKIKPFKTWQEALLALQKFVKQHNLPKPMVVSSGNGLHVYWVMDRDLERHQWIPIANALKSIAPLGSDGKPIFDPAVPADTARVLRPVGTHNPKGGKEVRLLIDAPVCDADDFAALFKEFIGNSKPKKAPSTSSILANMAVESEFPPAEAGLVYKKCLQVQWCVDNQDQVDEPLWYSLMGIAAHCTDPHAAALVWSQDHPGFDQEATLQKLDQWTANTTGPATCAAFQLHRPKGCDGCKFKGEITTPCRLGIRYDDEPVSKKAPSEVAAEIPIPPPFRNTKQGIVANVKGVDVVICPFTIYPVSYGRDQNTNYEVVRYHWERHNVGWQELVVRAAHLTDGHREFGSTIADQGIVLDSKTQTESFQIMLRTYMQKLRSLRTISNLHSAMGWKENRTQFLLGDKLFKLIDGEVVLENLSSPDVVQQRKSAAYTSGGDPRQQVELTKLISQGKLDAHALALGLSFSSILYEPLNMKGLTINFQGITGAGKSLAQLWAQSVWGVPEELHVSAKSTVNAMYSRFAMHNHMIATVDEATTFDTKEIGDYLYNITQGQDKARLNRDASTQEPKRFKLPVLMSSNKSFSALLIGLGMDAEAQAMRLLEFVVPKNKLFEKSSAAGKYIFDALSKNYGNSGEVFVKHIMLMGVDVLRARYEEHRVAFLKEYTPDFTGPERFWQDCLIVSDFALTIAKELELIAFEPAQATTFALSQIAMMRSNITENRLMPFEILTEYFNDRASNAITVIYDDNSKRGLVDFNSIPHHGGIRIRFELFRTDHTALADRGRVLIDITDLKRWLALRGVDYKYIAEKIAVDGVDRSPPTKKYYLGKDTPLKIGQARVIGIDLTHPELEGLLRNTDAAVDNTVLNKLRVIK